MNAFHVACFHAAEALSLARLITLLMEIPTATSTKVLSDVGVHPEMFKNGAHNIYFLSPRRRLVGFA